VKSEKPHYTPQQFQHCKALQVGGAFPPISKGVSEIEFFTISIE